MAFYLMRFSYTPETWSKLIQNPEDEFCKQPIGPGIGFPIR
jgi:hypothetical protein